MRSSQSKAILKWMAVSILVGTTATAFVGCGKKDAEPEAATAKPAAEQPAAEASQSSGESTTDAVVFDATQQVTAADYDKAVKGGDYVKATDALLRLNAQGASAANSVSRMHELQEEVARAAANGDPKAIQAAAMLRRIGRMPSAPARGN